MKYSPSISGILSPEDLTVYYSTVQTQFSFSFSASVNAQGMDELEIETLIVKS